MPSELFVGVSTAHRIRRHNPHELQRILRDELFDYAGDELLWINPKAFGSRPQEGDRGFIEAQVYVGHNPIIRLPLLPQPACNDG